MPSENTTVQRKRRPPARHRDVIMAAADERLLMLDRCMNLEDVASHTARIRELFEELRRSLNKETGDE